MEADIEALPIKQKLTIELQYSCYKQSVNKNSIPSWVGIVYPRCTRIMTYNDYLADKPKLEKRFNLDVTNKYKQPDKYKKFNCAREIS